MLQSAILHSISIYTVTVVRRTVQRIAMIFTTTRMDITVPVLYNLSILSTSTYTLPTIEQVPVLRREYLWNIDDTSTNSTWNYFTTRRAAKDTSTNSQQHLELLYDYDKKSSEQLSQWTLYFISFAAWTQSQLLFVESQPLIIVRFCWLVLRQARSARLGDRQSDEIELEK